MEAGTSTLADNLLDDLDDLSDLDDEEKSPPQLHQHQETPPGEDGESSLLVASTGTNQPRLLAEAPLQSHVVTIGSWKSSSSNEDAAREYQLIVHSNKWLTKLSDELAAIHVALRQVYHVKFPELADLLPDARQYQQAVQTIRNETDLTRVNQALNEFLTANQVITLTVSASTTGGRTLTEEELSACDTWTAYMRQIEETQQLLMDFVAGCMHNLAPAVCALTGPALAARLIGLAGGLVELSVIPACNIEILGQTKQTSSSRAGFGSQAGQPHQGILVRTALVQSVAQSERRKVLKWVAAKVALAARCDATAVQQGRPRSGKPGEQFYEALRKKVQHLQAPDQAPVLKALPK
jgi:U4/U6 small nuclear ribonucleoprotein PRP31